MKKIICNLTYDTDASEIVKKTTYGVFGDENGYEETLYVTKEGKYFLYTNGGSASKHKKADIKRMSKATKDKWLSEN